MFSFLKDWALTQGSALLSTVAKTVTVAVVGILAVRIVMKIVDKTLEKSKLEKAAHSLIKTLIRTVLYILLALTIASSLGINVTGVVAIASVASLAVSLALQNMLANVIGGFTLLYTHPFSSGDYVEIAGQSGTVQEIGMTYTKLTTPDNKLISIPNSAVVAAEIVNYTVTGTRRLTVDIQVSYGSDPEKVIAALHEAVTDQPVLPDPAPFAALSGYGDSAVQYTLRVWVQSDDYWDVHFAIHRKLMDSLNRDGIEMTYNHLNVHLDK